MKMRTDGITWQELDGEMVILDLNGSTYLTTNATGTVLAQALADDQTEDSLADLLVETYDIDRSQARADVTSFLAQLRAKRLLAD